MATLPISEYRGDDESAGAATDMAAGVAQAMSEYPEALARIRAMEARLTGQFEVLSRAAAAMGPDGTNVQHIADGFERLCGQVLAACANVR